MSFNCGGAKLLTTTLGASTGCGISRLSSLRHDQLRLLEDRNLYRGKKFGLDCCGDLDREGLRTERRHRNDFRHVILPDLHPFRHKQFKIDDDQQQRAQPARMPLRLPVC